MQHRIRLFLCLVVFGSLFGGLISSASAAPQAPQAESMDAIVTQVASKFAADPRHVGLSIGIVKDGISHTYHFGSTDRSARNLPTDHSIYEIASVTKTYTGILLAQAVVDGKIKLDDGARKYLPELSNLSFEGQEIKIRDLANHTAGLPKQIRGFQSAMSPADILAMYGDYSQQQFLQDVKKIAITDRAGAHFNYSNVGAQLIGIVLERTYHMRYEDLVEKFITRPNRMVDTATSVPVGKQDRYAKGYDGTGNPMPEMSFWRTIPAAGSLKSTLSDQLNYLQWNLDETNPAVALSHRVTFTSTEEHGDDIALFWFVKHLPDGSRVIRHAGGSFGSSSYCAIYPDAQTGIVLLANDADASTEKALTAMASEIAQKIAAH